MISRPVLAWMLMLSLILFGAISLSRLGISQYPDVDSPVLSISLNLEGASPSVVERDLVDPVEDALMSIAGIQSLSSSSKAGSASFTVEFDMDRDIDVVLQEVQSKLASVQRVLPKEVEPAVISKSNPDDQPILWISLSSSKHSRVFLMEWVRDQIKNRLTMISGVGEVFLGGFVDPAFRVWVKPGPLRRLELTVQDLVQAFQIGHAEPPAGAIEQQGKMTQLRVLGELDSLKAIQDLRIPNRGGAPTWNGLRISDVAQVEKGMLDAYRLSRAGGLPAVGLGIRKQRGSNAVQVAKAVKAELQKIIKDLPPGMEAQIQFDATTFIEESTQELLMTLIVSALLTALVCWVFLGSWSSTLNVLMSIPTSILGTFVVLHFLGFTLNTFTLLALSLSIGIVVDDAIMVLENIMRHRSLGLAPAKAAAFGAREITFSALAATLSLVAIFLPVAFMNGVIGKFFFQFGITLSVAVVISLIEALTFTPMRCAQWMATESHGRWFDRKMFALEKAYQKFLEKCLKRPLSVLAGSLLLFVASLFLLRAVPKEFVPAQDQGRLMIRVQAPLGSTLEQTDRALQGVEQVLKNTPEVEKFFGSIGGAGASDVNSGMLFVSLKDKNQRKRSQVEVQNALRDQFKSFKLARVMVQDLSLRGFGGNGRGFPVEFKLQGSDWNELVKEAFQFSKALVDQKILSDVDTNAKGEVSEIQIIPDRRKAMELGVPFKSIGETVSTLMSGLTVAQIEEGGHRIPVRIKLEDPPLLKSLYVRNVRGELIPLESLVTVHKGTAPQAVFRENRRRSVNVYGNLAPGISQEQALERVQSLAKEQLKDGTTLALTGSAESFKDSFRSLLFALGLGFIVAYMILASQFNHYWDPLFVLLALPFSVSGAFLALWMTHQSLNLYSMIGILLLMGIVKKNSILIVDFTRQSYAQLPKGGTWREALLHACPRRLRAILMTSIATIVGTIPSALALGPGSESRVPMGVAVIGGALLSTVLSLVVVPCAMVRFSKDD